MKQILLLLLLLIQYIINKWYLNVESNSSSSKQFLQPQDLIWFLYQIHERNLINISGQEKQRQQKKHKSKTNSLHFNETPKCTGVPTISTERNTIISPHFSHVQSTIEVPLVRFGIHLQTSVGSLFYKSVGQGPDLQARTELREEINVWQLQLQAQSQKQEASFLTFHTWPHNITKHHVHAWSADATLTASALSPQPWICSEDYWVLSNPNTAQQTCRYHGAVQEQC